MFLIIIRSGVKRALTLETSDGLAPAGDADQAEQAGTEQPDGGRYRYGRHISEPGVIGQMYIVKRIDRAVKVKVLAKSHAITGAQPGGKNIAAKDRRKCRSIATAELKTKSVPPCSVRVIPWPAVRFPYVPAFSLLPSVHPPANISYTWTPPRNLPTPPGKGVAHQ